MNRKNGMKKMALCIVPLIMVIMGCASGKTAVAAADPTSSSTGIDLDAAIKEAAGKMGTNLSAKTQVALVSVASPSAQFSEYVIARLEAALVDGGKLTVVDRANLDKIREEQGFQLSGEVDDNSAKNIGKLLGAGAIVTGAFANLGDVYSLTLKAINIETATVAVSYPADITKSMRIETLLASGGGAVNSGAARGGGAAGTQTAQRGTAGGNTPAAAVAAAEPAKVYKIGDTGPAGGIIFYDKGNSSDGWRYLEAALWDAATAIWQQGFSYADTSGPYNIPGTATAPGLGKRNTEVIIQIMKNNGKTGWAAQMAREYQQGGSTDWYMPSRDELNLLYRNLKQSDLGDFDNNWYWSSSEYSQGQAWSQNFSDGKQVNENYKNKTYSVRAVRQF